MSEQDVEADSSGKEGTMGAATPRDEIVDRTAVAS
jgi:hypothetical protein